MALASWRWIFGVLALAGAASLALTAFALPETLAPGLRTPARPRQIVAGCRRLLTNAEFVGLTFVGGFGLASFFVFIASASFVYTQTFGLTPTGFSLAFALNAIGFFGATQAAASLGERYGMARVVRVAIAGFALVAVALAVLVAAGFGTLAVVVGMLFVGNAFLGLVIPVTAVLSLDPHPDIAGLASSLGGTLQMLTGGLMIAVAGPFFDGTPLPMVVAIALCGLLAWGTSAAALRSGRVAEAR